MTHKRNARRARPDPAAQDPMDYLLDDVMQATDRVAEEFNNMAGLEADPVAALAEHCHTLAGRLAALAEVVRQMRDLQRGLVVISDPPMPAPVLMTEAGQAERDLLAAQRSQAARTLVRWRMGDDGLEPVYADQDLAAGVDPAEVRDGLDAGTDGQQDGLQANLEASRPDGVIAGPTAEQLAAHYERMAAHVRPLSPEDLPPVARMTHAEARAEAERLGGIGGAMFLMHWAGAHGGQ